MDIISKLILIFCFAYIIFFIWVFYTKFKGAEYAPTTSKKAKIMLQFAAITKKDIVYDLGSGFGGLVLASAKKAKLARGIEFDWIRTKVSALRAKILGLKNASFTRDDFFNLDINDASVVFLFLRQGTNQRLKAKLKRLKKGSRIVSNIWTLSGWKAVKVDKKYKLYLYIIGQSDR